MRPGGTHARVAAPTVLRLNITYKVLRLNITFGLFPVAETGRCGKFVTRNQLTESRSHYLVMVPNANCWIRLRRTIVINQTISNPAMITLITVSDTHKSALPTQLHHQPHGSYHKHQYMYKLQYGTQIVQEQHIESDTVNTHLSPPSS